jgi:hypothetical protein
MGWRQVGDSAELEAGVVSTPAPRGPCALGAHQQDGVVCPMHAGPSSGNGSLCQQFRLQTDPTGPRPNGPGPNAEKCAAPGGLDLDYVDRFS